MPTRLSCGKEIEDRPRRSRISTKFSTARSAMASVFTLRACSNSRKLCSQSAPRRVQQLQEHGAILEPAIDSLAKERNDCVRGIAEQERLSCCVPGRTFDGNHCASRVRKVVLRTVGA